MTFHIHTRHCARCHTGTPHEIDADNPNHAYCVTCRERKPTPHEAYRFHSDPSNTAAHIAALDGMGNRGETRKPTKGEQRK